MWARSRVRCGTVVATRSSRNISTSASLRITRKGAGICFGQIGSTFILRLIDPPYLAEFSDFLKTINKWLDKVTNYFLERHTSGFVEGFNNRIKVMKRRCYGIFKVNRIFQRLTLDLYGYERFGAV